MGTYINSVMVRRLRGVASDTDGIGFTVVLSVVVVELLFVVESLDAEDEDEVDV